MPDPITGLGPCAAGPHLVEIELRDACSPPETLKGEVQLLWTDIPYGTGKIQTRGEMSFNDPSDNAYVLAALRAWVPMMWGNGVICICCDYRSAPDVVAAVRAEGWVYRGEVIWEFALGRPRTSWWPVRHNNIVTFTRTPDSGCFYKEAIPRTRRLAPKQGYGEDKPAGSVWEFTFSNTHSERVGYPNQKPLTLVEPFVLAHTDADDLVADPFCGSGTTGVAAVWNGRRFYGCDTNPQAVQMSLQRLDSIQLDLARTFDMTDEPGITRRKG